MQLTNTTQSDASLDCPAMVKWVTGPFDPVSLKKWASWLKEDELPRLAGYRRTSDQNLFLARRGLARECLGTTRSIKPQSIRFIEKPSGKLSWTSDDFRYGTACCSMEEFDFSISRTAEMAAAAVCRTHDVGIDVERITRLPELETLATQNLHPLEHEQWLRLPSEERLHAYYRLWVVKEAFVKGLGTGFVLSPREILANNAIGDTKGIIHETWQSQNVHKAAFSLKSIGSNCLIAVVTLNRTEPDAPIS